MDDCGYMTKFERACYTYLLRLKEEEEEIYSAMQKGNLPPGTISNLRRVVRGMQITNNLLLIEIKSRVSEMYPGSCSLKYYCGHDLKIYVSEEDCGCCPSAILFGHIIFKEDL